MQFEVKYHWSNHYSALTGVKCEFVQPHRGGFWNSNMFEGGAFFNSEYFWGEKKTKPSLLQYLIRNWQVFCVGPSAHGASVYLSGWQNEGMSKREIQIK